VRELKPVTTEAPAWSKAPTLTKVYWPLATA